MMRVRVTDLKNRLSHYLRLVKRGETIEVMDRSVPVARVQAVPPAALDHDAHLQRLIRDGIVTPARKKPSLDILKHPPVPCSVDAVRVLIEERGDR